MTAAEVKARTRLLGFIAASGRKLTYREKANPDSLMAIAADIFAVPMARTLVETAERIQALGKQQRGRRCGDYRRKNSIDHPQAVRLFRSGRKKAPKKPAAQPIQICAPNEAAIRNFYDSWEWKRLSFDVKLERGRKCECCGAKAPDVRIITDHIKPIRHHWHLRLERANLQILCDDCNMGKGSRNETDFRTSPTAPCLDVAPDYRAALDGPAPPSEPVIWN